MNAPVSEAAVLEPLAGVARQAGAPDLADQLLAMRQWMAIDLQQLEEHLRHLEGLETEPEAAKAAAQYVLESGGKRVRP